MAARILFTFIFLAFPTLARPQIIFGDLSISDIETVSQDITSFDVSSIVGISIAPVPPVPTITTITTITTSGTDFVVGSGPLVLDTQISDGALILTLTGLQSPTSTPTAHATPDTPSVVGLSVGGSVLALSLVVVLYYFFRKRKQRRLLDTCKTGLGEKGLDRCPPEQKRHSLRISTNLQHTSTGVVNLSQGGATDEPIMMAGDMWSSDATGVHTNPTVSEHQSQNDGYQQPQQDLQNTPTQSPEVYHQQPLSTVLPHATPRPQQSVVDVSSSVDLLHTESENELPLVSSSYGRRAVGGDVDLILRHIVELHGEMGQIRSQLQQLQSLEPVYEPSPPSYY